MSTIFIISNPVIAVKPIPINTDIIELILCLTTSVSFLASILGYFKLTIIPIVDDINGNTAIATSIKSMLIKSNSNFINSKMLPASKTGIITKHAVNTLDLTIVYRYADSAQIQRLQQYVRCVKFVDGMRIKCKRAFFNYGIDIIDSVDAQDYCFVIHADYKDQMERGQLTKIPEHPKLNRYIAVSKRAADSFHAVTGKRVEVCYNPFIKCL